MTEKGEGAERESKKKKQEEKSKRKAGGTNNKKFDTGKAFTVLHLKDYLPHQRFYNCRASINLRHTHHLQLLTSNDIS